MRARVALLTAAALAAIAATLGCLLVGMELACVPPDAPPPDAPNAAQPPAADPVRVDRLGRNHDVPVAAEPEDERVSDSRVDAGPSIDGVLIHAGGPRAEERPSVTVITDPPARTGTLPREAVDAVVRAGHAALQACAGATPELSGFVVAKFVVNKEGVVVQAQLAETSIARPDVEECVKRTIRSWKFPPPAGGHVIISYPVLFAPKKR